jgi:hypothetical protein
MSIIERHVPFVKEQLGIQEKLSKRYEADKWRSDLHAKSAQNFQALLQDIEILSESERMQTQNSEITPSRKSIFLTYKDIEGLPEELLKELSLSEADKFEGTISRLIDEAGGVLSLDKILVGVYFKTKEILRRNILISRLYRMAQKDLIFSVPNRKGVYSTRQLTEDDAKRIFGLDDSGVEFELRD